MQFAMPGMTPMVKRLLVVHAVVWAFSLILSFSGGATSDGLWGPFRDVFALAPDTWRSWFPFVPIWQLLTYGFLHSIQDPTHILFNLLFLYFLGTMLEGLIGSRRFLATYLAGILCGGIAALGFTFAMSPGAPYPVTLGASGGVFTVVVATAVLRPDTRIIFIIIPLTLKVFALFYVGLNVFSFLQALFKGGATAVSYSAHLGGALWGYLTVKRGWVWKDPVAAVESQRAERAGKRKVDDERRVDALLEQIHKHGIQSLSTRDRAFLKRVSKNK
jgi:membrane associated rhomboid family serine protease